MDCIFCKIITREIPGQIVTEDDQVIVFLSLQNHPLIVPKKHIENIYSLDDETGAKLISETVRVAKAVKSELIADGINIIQNNEPASGQTVNHLHIHIRPRWHQDKVELNFEVDHAKLTNKEQILTKLKSALQNS